MGKFEKIRPKSRSEQCFLMNFSDFFRKPQGLPKGRFEDFSRFFDVLKLQGPSLNDPWWILETLFFYEIFWKINPKCQVEFPKNSYVYPTKPRSEARFWKLYWFSLTIFNIIKFNRQNFEKFTKQNWKRIFRRRRRLGDFSACAVITLSYLLQESCLQFMWKERKRIQKRKRTAFGTLSSK